MKFADLINLYEEKKKKYGVDTYKHFQNFLKKQRFYIRKIGRKIRLRRKIMSSHGKVLREAL